MKITKDTIAILKNFATIQPNFVYKGDGKLKTLAEANNIMAEAKLVEDITSEISIYDLNEFLSVLNLTTDPDVQFEENCAVITDDSSTVKYVFANPSILTAPTKEINMPTPEVKITISGDDIEALRRAASVLGYNIVSISNDASGGNLKLSVVDNSGAGKNTFTIEKNFDGPTEKFDFRVLINNLKIMPDDYTVELSSKMISKWVGSKVVYYIAIENSSTYGA
jgi:hypothetical protein